MIYVKPNQKDIYMPYLRQKMDFIKEKLLFPERFSFDFDETLKDYIREMDAKYENVFKKKDDVFMNLFKPDEEDQNLISFIKKEDYWTTVPFLDILYDYLMLLNPPEDGESLSRNHVTFKQYLLRTLDECITEGYSEDNYKKHRLKPGKFLQKLFPDATPQECETFQQKWFMHYAQWGWENVILVSGKDILKYYHKDAYFNHEGTLGSSCMRNTSNQLQVQWYRNNDVKMAIFKHPDTDKIRARALVWDVSVEPDVAEEYNIPEHFQFLDRIYSITEKDKIILQTYAKNKNMMRKNHQGPGWTGFITPDDREITDAIDFIFPLKNPHGMWPYLDTMTNFVNENDGNLGLHSTLHDAGITSDDFVSHGIYDPVYDRYIHPDHVNICRNCLEIYDTSSSDEETFHKEKNCQPYDA